MDSLQEENNLVVMTSQSNYCQAQLTLLNWQLPMSLNYNGRVYGWLDQIGIMLISGPAEAEVGLSLIMFINPSLTILCAVSNSVRGATKVKLPSLLPNTEHNWFS